jgi:hypothetical protein
MPRNISFMLTKEQVKNRTKTVTRRTGWTFLKPGDVLNAVEKGMGLKKGEKVKFLCQIKIIKVSREALISIDYSEVIKEGFPEMKPADFIKMFCSTHKKIDPSKTITRIEFKYL